MSQEQESQEQESQEQESQEQDSPSQLWRWLPGDGEINELDVRGNDMGNETIVPILMSIINSLSSPPLPPPNTPLPPPNTPLPSPNTPPQQLPNTPPPSPNTPLYILSYYTTPPPNTLQPLQPPQITRIRRRDEDDAALSHNKYIKVAKNRRVNSSLFLKSGEEFYFNKTDGVNILLNNTAEPNRLIRNIISRVPPNIKERLKFLALFDYEEEIDEGADEGVNEGANEGVNEGVNEGANNHKKVEKRYIGNLKELVYEAYIKESRLKFLFKRFLALWRVHKMDKSCESGVDPITLVEPVKPVYVYDWANKKKFVFDAKSLATLIESKLMYQEYGFSMPQYPRNPNNNVDFTYKQLVSIYFQFKDYGELRWGFNTIREYNFSLSRWIMYHKSALTMNSIKKSISLLDTTEDRELFTDFIFAKLDKLRFVTNINAYRYYQTAMLKDPKNWYLERLKAVAISHYEAAHFGYYVDDFVDAECLEIFQKQTDFFKDLRNKKLI